MCIHCLAPSSADGRCHPDCHEAFIANVQMFIYMIDILDVSDINDLDAHIFERIYHG